MFVCKRLLKLTGQFKLAPRQEYLLIQVTGCDSDIGIIEKIK